MKYSTKQPEMRTDAEREELIGVLTAISVVSKRLARKLTAASYQSNHTSEYECPLRQEGRNHEALRDQRRDHAPYGRD